MAGNSLSLADSALDDLDLVRKRSDGTFIARRASDGAKFVLRRIEGEDSELRRLDAVASLRHPNIHAIEGVVRKPDHAIVVSAWVEGTTLSRILRARRQKHIPMEEDEALAIFTQLCTALAYAHATGVVHHAISANSVTICTDGRVVLRDWDASNGNLRCPAPERCASVLADSFNPAHTTTSNSWALGCVLFEMLSLEPLFDSATGANLLRAVRHAPPPPIPEEYSADAQVSFLLFTVAFTRILLTI
jgi:NIMA (never in mitosis gene a)-related kinase